MPRVKTGIEELDEMLKGGFMEGDAVILAGSAGTGKTTLALQYLVNGVKLGEGGVYVTFEQLPSQIYRDAENFGWNLRKLEEDKKFRIVCTSPDLLLNADGEHILDEVIKEIQPSRIVVDSLSHLAMYVDEKEMRKEAYRIIMYLKTRGLSSMFIWETPQIVGQTFSVTDLGMSFLVDAIVMLRLVEVESSMRKALAILKMRGSDHDKRLREFDITPQGIRVSTPFTGYEGVMTGSPRKVARLTAKDLAKKGLLKKR
ncbi:MAG: AAA family ATPase [Thaumarchaeota archaeon]|nr:AAA family ATPase [Nitrososphaerota archaeon]